MKVKVKIKASTVKHLKNYFKENWGAPFILAFIALLIAAAGYLSMGNEAVANDIAIYAYYALTAGVLLQLAAYIKYERRTSSKGKARNA